VGALERAGQCRDRARDHWMQHDGPRRRVQERGPGPRLNDLRHPRTAHAFPNDRHGAEAPRYLSKGAGPCARRTYTLV
jgi:hypothetical protein